MSTTMFSSMAGTSSESRSKPDLAGLFSNADLPPAVSAHLVRVYALLAWTVLAAAVGSALHLYTGIGGTLSTIASFGLLMALGTAPASDAPRREKLLLAFGLAQGLSTGPLVALAAAVDPSIITTAFVGTAAVFACFTASALTARRQTYMALGGLLSSGLSLLLLVGFVNIFFRSAAAYQLHLYGGLVLFAGYVLYDTQVIVERARAGDRDHVAHALELFIDFVAILVRLIVILLQNSGKKDEDDRRRKRTTSRR